MVCRHRAGQQSDPDAVSSQPGSERTGGWRRDLNDLLRRNAVVLVAGGRRAALIESFKVRHERFGGLVTVSRVEVESFYQDREPILSEG